MNHSTYFIFLLSLSLLTSCGGGGGSGSQQPPTNMIIDTDSDGVLDDEDIDDDNDGLIEISTLEQLDWMRNDPAGEALVDHDGNSTFAGCPGNVCSGYELVADLDFDTNGDGLMDANDTYFDYDADGQNNGWLPVGWLPTGGLSAFVADFDGNNHRISNLYIDRTSDFGSTSGLYIGLFGYVDGGVRPVALRNIIFDGVYADVSGSAYVGALVGFAISGVTVTNVVSNVSVAGENYHVGGLIGAAPNVEIIDSTTSGDVTGRIDIASRVGGLVGFTNGTLVIRNSYALGKVSGREEVGGVLGRSFQADVSIIDSGASGDVNADLNYAGGLVGRGEQGLSIQSSSASGAVSSDEYVGGLVGSIQDNGSITASFASGNISGQRYVGGVAGHAAGVTISDSYASGDVDGLLLSTGGLVGLAESAFSITGSYAAGNITGAIYTGGLIGRAAGGGNVQQSYFTGTVAASGDYTGGVIGSANFKLASPVGTGLVAVEQVFVTGDVSGTGYVGGLIGLSYNLTLDDGFATGTVTGTTNYIGGLFGDANAGTELIRGLAANVVTLIGTPSIGALVGYSDGATYTDNYHANDQGIANAIGQNLDGGSNPAGTTGGNLAALQLVTTAGENGLFANWGTVWDFGSNAQLPGLVINGVIFRDGDANGVVD